MFKFRHFIVFDTFLSKSLYQNHILCYNKIYKIGLFVSVENLIQHNINYVSAADFGGFFIL